MQTTRRGWYGLAAGLGLAGSRGYRRAGHVTGNRSPFNLFTFPSMPVTDVLYVWVASPDGHARIAELEGFLDPRALTLD